jgi:hypothetical protein
LLPRLVHRDVISAVIPLKLTDFNISIIRVKI